MFDFIRNLAKSAEEKRLETLNAYLDGELSAREQRQFEEKLAEDPALRAEMAQLRQVKQGIGQLPRVRAPRNFTLNPAVYGRPQPQPAYELYPVLRVATALAAFFFIVAVVLDLATPAGGLGQPLAAVSRQEAPAADVEMAEEAAEAEQPVVTRVVEEVVVESEAVEEPQALTATVEEEEMAAAAEEEAMEEEAMEAETAAEVAEEPAEQQDAERTEEPAAEAEVMTAPTEDEGAAADEEAPALAAPAAASTATATAPAGTLPPPTLSPESPEAEPLPAEEPVDGGLPILLIAEIVLGAGLIILLTVTLLIRRNL